MRNAIGLSLLILSVAAGLSSATASTRSSLAGHKVCFSDGGIAQFQSNGHYGYTYASGREDLGTWIANGNRVKVTFSSVKNGQEANGAYREDDITVSGAGDVAVVNIRGVSPTGRKYAGGGAQGRFCDS